MPAPVVWINKYLSNTWELVARLRERRSPGEFHLLCSHPRRTYPGRFHADEFEIEPGGLRPDAYVEFATDFARRRRVTLFVPGRKLLAIVRAQHRFAGFGTRLLAAADAATLEILADKGKTYAALADVGFRLPDHAVVNDLAGFDAAWEQMRPWHGLLCFKPCVSVYGLGFHVVADRPPAADRLPDRTGVYRSLDDARRRLAARGRFRDLMLMQHLPGPERSVDCLARHGQLLRCVVRRKEQGGQWIEEHPSLAAAIGRLTARFGLHGLFNVQFRDAEGTPHLLEINTRMSGGLPFACESGLEFLLWAIRLELAIAMPEDVPHPRSGIWVPQPVPMPSI